jgi:hypothetical protein
MDHIRPKPNDPYQNFGRDLLNGSVVAWVTLPLTRPIFLGQPIGGVNRLADRHGPVFDKSLDGTVYLIKNGPNATVFDDEVEDDLTGPTGDYWFLFDLALDGPEDWVGGETKTNGFGIAGRNCQGICERFSQSVMRFGRKWAFS